MVTFAGKKKNRHTHKGMKWFHSPILFQFSALLHIKKHPISDVGIVVIFNDLVVISSRNTT